MLNTQILKRYYPSSNGYAEVVLADGRIVYEHRWVMTQIVGRELQAWEVVHHTDRDKGNNNPSNLRLMHRAEHAKLHRQRPTPRISLVCGYCTETFTRDLCLYNRGLRNGQIKFCCSRRCNALYNRSNHGWTGRQ